MTRGLIMVLCLLSSVAGPAKAEVTPSPGTGDPRIQSVTYDPQEVVMLKVALGFQLVVEFSSDERIESVSLGNGAVWQVTPNKVGDHLFIKPMQGAMTTNLTVISAVHRYNFTLSPAEGVGEVLPYVVRFDYPPRPAPAPPVASASASRYRFSGDRMLRPSELRDDGRLLYLAWPEGVAFPAVFADGPGGEALVNGAMRDGYLVIESAPDRLVFRSGRRKAQAVRQASGATP